MDMNDSETYSNVMVNFTRRRLKQFHTNVSISSIRRLESSPAASFALIRHLKMALSFCRLEVYESYLFCHPRPQHYSCNLQGGRQTRRQFTCVILVISPPTAASCVGSKPERRQGTRIVHNDLDSLQVGDPRRPLKSSITLHTSRERPDSCDRRNFKLAMSKLATDNRSNDISTLVTCS